MLDSMDQYWTVSEKKLYPKDTYHREHTIDVREFYMTAFKVSAIATMLIFAIGIIAMVI